MTNGAMLLTDIALHLLGNTIYNTNGEPVDNLTCLYKFNQSEQKVNRNKKHLMEVLGICEENGRLKACASQSNSENSDDEVIHVGPPDEIVHLVDDDDDAGGVATSSGDERSKIPSTSEVQGHPTQVPYSREHVELDSSQDDENSMEDDTGSSADESHAEKSLPSALPAYLSPDLDVRLDFFKKAVKLEREKLLKSSEQKKMLYLNAHRQRSKPLTEEQLLQMFRTHQKDELYDEMRNLMQFIRIIKHTDKCNHDLISEIGKDILAAKNVNESAGEDYEFERS